ncbi:hypothetical protein PTTG_05871 [Puccinia triticina 1-1 BBBD Race 1]|uniref:DNA 3'-5' helicase n=1 Tax=Puccinia triticina (isolate 1-1 / race 1 (BBBD)) TaxID=630390 RepID=A0A180GU46_PUCT1|nr:hypothetical protein PTTG_05871 [Puccinia triticina 1-1 BBBD Race 1]
MELLQKTPVKPKANKLPEALEKLTDNSLAEHITTRSIELYHDQPKDLQVAAVSSLVRGKNTFVRVGTRYGKTRISEMFFGLFTKKVVVLVLNPLDSLGDDQVREKKLLKITAINLNKMTLNLDVVQKIKKGKFSFVYLSPEVFLNNSLFTELFFSDEFQDILSLFVVDEAHMIYLWGLVASKQSKTLIIFARLEDQAVFRPGYGHLGTRIMATNNIPVLLLSATCRPVAVSAITTSLMLQPSDINMIDGELTRPEIRFIRIKMESTLSSCDDLLRIFAPRTVTPACDSVPMIIYSGTRNRTFQVMKVVNEARNTKNHEYDPNDGFIRRYHSVTSDEDKLKTMEDFGNGKVPVISATMALGLGQNLKRVRCVVHMGRGDPATIVQMVGRCGRDGNVGLGLLFMEPTRKNGRNKVGDFEEGLVQNDDARMDALAATGVCLRVALTLDSKLGYIPLAADDPNVLSERAREKSRLFSKCTCSNCAPEEAAALINVLQQMNISNFDSLLKDPSSIPQDPSIVTMIRKRKKQLPKGTCSYPKHVADDLEQHLLHSFDCFYFNHLRPRPEFSPSTFFGVAEAKAIFQSIHQIRDGDNHNTTLLERLSGGQAFDGQIEYLDLAISDWMSGEYYQQHLLNISELEKFIEAEGIRVREEMAIKLAVLQASAAARRASARLLKAEDQAVEKARLLSEKAAEKLCREEEKLAKRKYDAQERAALKAAQKAQSALDKLAPNENSATLAIGETDFISQDTLMADGIGETSTLVKSKSANSLSQRQAAEAREASREMASKQNRLDEEEKAVNRAARRANADLVRLANEAKLAEETRNRVQMRKATRVGAQAKKSQKNCQKMAKIMRERQHNSAFEAMREQLQRGA